MTMMMVRLAMLFLAVCTTVDSLVDSKTGTVQDDGSVIFLKQLKLEKYKKALTCVGVDDFSDLSEVDWAELKTDMVEWPACL